MQAGLLTLAAGILLAIGFAAGYVAREMVSRRRRWKIEKAEELWR